MFSEQILKQSYIMHSTPQPHGCGMPNYNRMKKESYGKGVSMVLITVLPSLSRKYQRMAW